MSDRYVIRNDAGWFAAFDGKTVVVTQDIARAADFGGYNFAEAFASNLIASHGWPCRVEADPRAQAAKDTGTGGQS